MYLAAKLHTLYRMLMVEPQMLHWVGLLLLALHSHLLPLWSKNTGVTSLASEVNFSLYLLQFKYAHGVNVPLFL